MVGNAAVDRVGETVARGLIAKAARSALRDATVDFGERAAESGLKGSAKDILKSAERDAVSKLGSEGRSAAQAVFKRAADNEPSITRRLTGLVDTVKGGKLVGLEFRTKSEESLLRKVATDVADGQSVREAAGGVNDAIRYTIRSSRSDYERVTREAIEKMKDAGFTPVSHKNFWGQPGYQGINSVWRDAGGQTFEMQFHTFESLAAKERTHEIYEMARVFPKDSAANSSLSSIQNRVFDRVTRPSGASGLHWGSG